MTDDYCAVCKGSCEYSLPVAEEAPPPQTITPQGIESEEILGDL